MSVEGPEAEGQRLLQAGVQHLRMQRAQQAIPLLEGAAARLPGRAEVFVMLAHACILLQQWERAIAAQGRALELDPADPNGWYNLGNCCAQAGRPEEARAAFRETLARDPGHGDAKHNLAVLLEASGRGGEAAELLDSILGGDPADAVALGTRAGFLRDRGRIPEALAMLAKARALAAGDARLHAQELFTLNYLDGGDPRRVLEAAHSWGRRWAGAPAPGGTRAVAVGRPLRVGYLGPDFRSHSVAFFLEPLLQGHDPDIVETTVYSLVEREDDVTLRLRKAAGRWRDLRGIAEAEAADRIRRDGIDILVDLAGHSSGQRLGIFAHRPAPVQIAWLGYPATTGLAAIQYRITDPRADPAGFDGHFTEALIRLQRGFLCYRPPADAPAPAPIRRSDLFTFGSFNALAKLNESVVRLWARILLAAPASRLFLKAKGLDDPRIAEDVLQRFLDAGVSADRLRLRGSLPGQGDHLGQYHAIDLALDPFPYNGTTTTCDALWMGVPVLTLAGDRHAARVGCSLLASLGLAELVAADAAGYEARAVALALDPAPLDGLKADLRARMQRSPLRDEAGFARSMEAAYGMALAAHYRNERPAPFEVP